MSIENYLNEALAYLVVRSPFGVTLNPSLISHLQSVSDLVRSLSKNPPVNNPMIGNESEHERLFVSSRSMTHRRKITGGKFVGWFSVNPPLLSHSE